MSNGTQVGSSSSLRNKVCGLPRRTWLSVTAMAIVALSGSAGSLLAQEEEDVKKVDMPQIVIAQPASPEAPPMPTSIIGTPVDADGNPIADCMPIIQPRQIDVATYRATYDAIPFSRTEYDANPSYRHDTAMEIMFGKMRPTTIHRYQHNTRPATQASPWWANAQPYWRNYGNSRIRLGVFYRSRYPSFLRRWY